MKFIKLVVNGLFVVNDILLQVEYIKMICFRISLLDLGFSTKQYTIFWMYTSQMKAFWQWQKSDIFLCSKGSDAREARDFKK